MKLKVKKKDLSAREIVEYMVLNQESFINDRDLKYYLGSVVAKKMLNQSDEIFEKEEKYIYS